MKNRDRDAAGDYALMNASWDPLAPPAPVDPQTNLTFFATTFFIFFIVGIILGLVGFLVFWAGVALMHWLLAAPYPAVVSHVAHAAHHVAHAATVLSSNPPRIAP